MYVFRFRKDLINIDQSDYHFFLPPPSHLSLYVFVGPSLNTDEGKVHQNNLIISNPWMCCVARKEDRKGLQDHRKSGSITLDTKDCHRYDFLVTYFRKDLIFSKTFFIFWIDHDPPCSLCSQNLCLFLFLCFSLHTITWPREVIIVL